MFLLKAEKRKQIKQKLFSAKIHENRGRKERMKRTNERKWKILVFVDVKQTNKSIIIAICVCWTLHLTNSFIIAWKALFICYLIFPFKSKHENLAVICIDFVCSTHGMAGVCVFSVEPARAQVLHRISSSYKDAVSCVCTFIRVNINKIALSRSYFNMALHGFSNSPHKTFNSF